MSSSEKRTIKINPELFKIPEKNISRKKKPSSGFKIKVKSEPKARSNKTLRRSVLNMIRDKQRDEYKKLFDDSKNKEKSKIFSQKNEIINEFNKDFKNTVDFFGSLVEKENQQQIKHNHTLKQYPNQNTESLIFHPMSENVSMTFPEVSQDIFPQNKTPVPIHIPRPRYNIPPPPEYGCMKRGILPTKRNWLKQTQKNIQPQTQFPPSQIHTNQPINTSYSVPTSYSAPTLKPSNEFTSFNNKSISEIKNDLSEKRQRFEKGSLIANPKNKLKYLKRRKIYKRTYKIGRSRIAPKVAVLISNKTIRNRISTEAQLLKQTPIQDVKKYLIKKGFIKVGTIAPNDVLRQMYESAHMICGEIDNHNSENLLFNFIHDSDK
jgi:hypothetical protein